MSSRQILVRRTWTSEILDSFEEFSLERSGSGYQLRGRTLIPRDGIRLDIDWSIRTREDWTTERAEVSIPGLAIDLIIEAEGRTWLVDGFERDDLHGCTDLDLGWTPATNTIPIRRMGGNGLIRAAWLRWPDLDLSSVDQHYTRVGGDRWIYRSGDFDAELTLDDDLVVTRYGDPPIWEAVVPE